MARKPARKAPKAKPRPVARPKAQARPKARKAQPKPVGTMVNALGPQVGGATRNLIQRLHDAQAVAPQAGDELVFILREAERQVRDRFPAP
jgi:hypothetical protein